MQNAGDPLPAGYWNEVLDTCKFAYLPALLRVPPRIAQPDANRGRA